MSTRHHTKNKPSDTGRIRFWRDPALPYLEVRQAWEVRSNYAPHTHAGLSLGLVDSGATLFRIHGQMFRISAGTAVLIPPGEMHSCNPDPEQRWANRMIYIDPCGLNNFVDTHLPLRQHYHSPQVLGQSGNYHQLHQLSITLTSSADPLIKEDALQRTLEYLLQSDAHNPARPLPAKWLKRMQDYLAAHCTEPLRLDDLSAEACLSRYHLIRSFKAATGMTPHAWLLDLRIKLARELLKKTRQPLSDIALQTGFADQSHFNRSFKERTAVTPGQYRQFS